MNNGLSNLPGRIICRIIGAGGVGQIVATFLVRYLCSLGVEARVAIDPMVLV